jgi:hypothetical protein
MAERNPCHSVDDRDLSVLLTSQFQVHEAVVASRDPATAQKGPHLRMQKQCGSGVTRSSRSSTRRSVPSALQP